MAILKWNCNLFDPQLDKENLWNITASKPASLDVAEFLLKIEENGEDLTHQFISGCAEQESRFDKPITKNKIFNVTQAPKKKKLSLENKVLELRMQRDLFGRILEISLAHKVDIEKM